MAATSTNVRNSAWNLVNILLYPVAFLAATPFFINRLGESEFGVWMLINSYVYIAVNVVGFGLPNSITAHIAEALGKNDSARLHAYINAASRILGRMSILTIAAAVAAWVLYLGGLNIFGAEIDIILVVATALIAIKFPEILYQSIFKGYERYDQASFYNILSRMLTLTAQVILVAMGYQLLEIFILNLAINLFMVFFQAIRIYKPLSGYRLVLFRALEERRELYHFGFWTWLQTLIAVISFQMDRFIVAYFLGTATVAYYVLASTIANHLHLAFEAIVGWFFPKVARLKENKPDIRIYFHTIRSFSVGTSLLVILLLYIVNEPVFTLWLGSEKYEKLIGFFRLFMIFEAFLILSIVPKLYLNGIKSLRFVTWLEFMFKFAVMAGMTAAFAYAGTAESLIWGQIAALAIFMPVEFYLVNKRVLFGNPWQESLLTMIPSVCIMLLILNNWLFIPVFVIAGGLAFWYYYLDKKRFNMKLLFE